MNKDVKIKRTHFIPSIHAVNKPFVFELCCNPEVASGQENEF